MLATDNESPRPKKPPNVVIMIQEARAAALSDTEVAAAARSLLGGNAEVPPHELAEVRNGIVVYLCVRGRSVTASL